ncbi:MAG: family 16 glycosylhydrolase [Candidatus Latescibacteria bacterium]|nr:family 16 glycosylhydrolase [Candidatus Latescibacterota bacterium]
MKTTTPPRRLGLKAFTAITLLCCGCAQQGTGRTSTTTPGNIPPTGWELVWYDEFSGAVVDTAKWAFQPGDGCALGLCGWGNDELQWYQAANTRLEAGDLVITAKQESHSGYQYTSSRLRTRGKGDWTYGRFDIRARLPTGRGIWPALWMLPTDEEYGGWAASGEIDIAELLGHEPNIVHGTTHYGGPWPRNTSTAGKYTLDEGLFADDYHLFTLEWEETELRWYIDGTLYHRQNKWHSDQGAYPAPFDRRFHLLINIAVGGNWPGAPDASTVFPQEMRIDYVRVYKKDTK